MSRKMMKLSVLCASLTLAAAMAGCGTSNKEGTSASSLANVPTVSETACAQCHSTAREPLTGEFIYEQFNDSPHVANGCQSCHGGGSLHNGVGPMPFAKPGPEQCNTCHTTNDSADYAASGHAHVETEDGEAKCNRCHTHEGAVLGMKNGFTGDKAVMDAMVNAPQATPNASVIQCSTCHVMHKGTLRTPVGWDPALKVGSATAGGSDEYKLCTGCHTYINPNGTLVASGNNGTAAYYHNTAWNRTIASTHWDNPATGTNLIMEGYVLRTNKATPCFDCHGHESKTNTNNLQSVVLEGTRYYGLTTPEPTIYTDWAKSAHGANILVKKYEAVETAPTTTGPDGNTYIRRNAALTDRVMAAGPNGDDNSWPHYDWDAGNRNTCQRCHSSTGAENFMKSPAKFNADGTQQVVSNVIQGYDIAQKFYSSVNVRAANTARLNNFEHLSGWARDPATGIVTPSGQNEALYCWGCHSNAGTGALHAPGAFKFGYKTSTAANGLVVEFDDVKNSNTCMTCHSGRTEIAQNIKLDPRTGTSASFIYPHYMPSSLILFQKGGFEYDGRSYTAPSFFAHDKIGVSAAGTGTTAGPCVGCHMEGPNSHLFTNVTKNDAGVITGITSTNCVTCHTGSNQLTAETLEAEAEEYHAAINVLAAAFRPRGVYYDKSANPYMFADPVLRARSNGTTNWKAVADSYGLTPAVSWKDVMGAAYNLYTLDHDAGWAHNRYYSKRLLWDSIDFIFDGVLDNDVVEAIDAQVTAGRLTAEDAAAAKAYLGSTRP